MVNFIDLLNQHVKPATNAIFCTQQDQQNKDRFTAYAVYYADGWHSLDRLVITSDDLGEAEKHCGYYMIVRPHYQDGYCYLMLQSDADRMAKHVAIPYLSLVARQHNRLFSVPPQPNVMEIMAGVTADQITFNYTIDYAKRIYTLISYRPYGEYVVSVNERLDPLAFDSALNAAGFYMADPPIHGQGWNYTALAVRGMTDGRHLISEATDLQQYQAKEAYLKSRLDRQVAYAV